MNTPITDAAETKRIDPDVSVVYGTVPAHVARRLETDRATFRQALIDIYMSPSDDSRGLANAALQAASKFEGEEHTP